MSKGKNKPSLRDISRERPTVDESSAIRAYLLTASDVEAAITSVGFLEHNLEDLLFYRLKIKDQAIIDDLMGDGGSLSTFYDKILLGFAIKLYGEEVNHNLHIVRRIRNVFAHSVRRVNFKHPLIIQELSRLRIRPRLSKLWVKELKGIQAATGGDARNGLFTLVGDCTICLLKRHNDLMGAVNSSRERRARKKLAAMLRARSPQGSFPKGSIRTQPGSSKHGSQFEHPAYQNFLALPPATEGED